jgi:hypothetical protein
MLGRGWLLFFWIAAAATLYRWPASLRAPLTVPIAVYLTAIGVGVGNNTLGWYGLPVFGFLMVAVGAFLADLWERPDLMRGALFGLLFVMYTLNLVVDPTTVASPAHQPEVRRAVILAVVVLIAPYCLVQVWPSRFRTLARATLLLSGTFCLVVFVSAVVRWEVIGPTFHDIDHHIYFP